VRVLKDNITIVGPEKAIIDATGFVNGIHVGADIFAPSQNPVCPAIAVHNFTVAGLTVRNAASNGIFLSGVDGYVIARGNYIYPPQPTMRLTRLCPGGGQVFV